MLIILSFFLISFFPNLFLFFLLFLLLFFLLLKMLILKQLLHIDVHIEHRLPINISSSPSNQLRIHGTRIHLLTATTIDFYRIGVLRLSYHHQSSNIIIRQGQFVPMYVSPAGIMIERSQSR